MFRFSLSCLHRRHALVDDVHMSRELTQVRQSYVREQRLTLGIAGMSDALGDVRPDLSRAIRTDVSRHLLSLALQDVYREAPATRIGHVLLLEASNLPVRSGLVYMVGMLGHYMPAWSESQRACLADALLSRGLRGSVRAEPSLTVADVWDVLTDLRIRAERGRA